MKNEVILIIPLCNPKIENFNNFITEIEKYFNKILIINDGSNKKYNDFFDNLTIKYAVLTNEVPLGKGACIKSGINYILENYKDIKYFAFLDYDFNVDAEDIIKCYKIATNNPNTIIIGKNYIDNSNKIKKIINNYIKINFMIYFNKLQDNYLFDILIMDKLMAKKIYKIKENHYDFNIKIIMKSYEDELKILYCPIKTLENKSQNKIIIKTLKEIIDINKLFLKYCIRAIIPYVLSLLLFILFFYYINSSNDLSGIIISNIISGIISFIFSIFVNYNNIYKINSLNKNIIYFIKKILKIIMGGFFIYILYNLLSINLLFSKIIIDVIMAVVFFCVFSNIRIENE